MTLPIEPIFAPSPSPQTGERRAPHGRRPGGFRAATGVGRARVPRPGGQPQRLLLQRRPDAAGRPGLGLPTLAAAVRRDGCPGMQRASTLVVS